MLPPVACYGGDCEYLPTTDFPLTTLPSVPYDGGENFICNCLPLFTGELCETFLLPCERSDSNNGNPCLNGGLCENVFNRNLNLDSDYSCTCMDGYTGGNCEILILCSLDPCLNSGNCTDAVDFSDYSCTCTDGFTNKNCQTDIPCFSTGWFFKNFIFKGLKLLTQK